MSEYDMLSTILWLAGAALMVASFGFLITKPRPNSRPKITLDGE